MSDVQEINVAAAVPEVVQADSPKRKHEADETDEAVVPAITVEDECVCDEDCACNEESDDEDDYSSDSSFDEEEVSELVMTDPTKTDIDTRAGTFYFRRMYDEDERLPNRTVAIRFPTVDEYILAKMNGIPSAYAKVLEVYLDVLEAGCPEALPEFYCNMLEGHRADVDIVCLDKSKRVVHYHFEDEEFIDSVEL